MHIFSEYIRMCVSMFMYSIYKQFFFFCFSLCIIKVYQEVFGYLIEEFKTYKPILSAIKNDYDITLGMYTLFIICGRKSLCKQDNAISSIVLNKKT